LVSTRKIKLFGLYQRGLHWVLGTFTYIPLALKRNTKIALKVKCYQLPIISSVILWDIFLPSYIGLSYEHSWSAGNTVTPYT